jgi:hypothetical protein
MTCSCLGGSSLATASLVRRSMTGRIRRRSVSSRSGAAPLSIGRRKCSWKALGRGNSPGATIDSSAHSSMRLFSMGVPVIAILVARAAAGRTE